MSRREICSDDSLTFTAERLFLSCSTVRGPMIGSDPLAATQAMAISAGVGQIGALAVSRAVIKSDPSLADEVLQAVRETISAAHRAESVHRE